MCDLTIKCCREIQRQGDNSHDKLFLMQCDAVNDSGDLVACARYNIQGELSHLGANHNSLVHVVLIVQVQMSSNMKHVGFQVMSVVCCVYFDYWCMIIY